MTDYSKLVLLPYEKYPDPIMPVYRRRLGTPVLTSMTVMPFENYFVVYYNSTSQMFHHDDVWRVVTYDMNRYFVTIEEACASMDRCLIKAGAKLLTKEQAEKLLVLL